MLFFQLGHQQNTSKEEEVSSPTIPKSPNQTFAETESNSSHVPSALNTPPKSSPTQSPPPVQSPGPTQLTHSRTILRTDVSYEDDSAMSQTSSTSGYRENCSLLLMAMESPPHASTSSSTIVPPSPDFSSCDPSMLINYETQDEDTLI